MSTGIAVRMLAPLIEDKRKDPGVVVVDQEGLFAVSLLSGHLGGANTLTRKVAEHLGALPVITTASDLTSTISADILGREQGWEIENGQSMTTVSAALVDKEPVSVFQDAGEKLEDIVVSMPPSLTMFTSLDEMIQSGIKYALLITDRILDADKLALLPNAIIYRPRSLVVGIGCNRGTDLRTIEEAVNAVFRHSGFSTKCIKNLATINLKKDECGLSEYAEQNRYPIEYFDQEQLRLTSIPSPASKIALRHVGVPSVCEAAAILSSQGQIVSPKKSMERAVTVAIARVPFEKLSPTPKGKLYIVGTGPGYLDHLSCKARESILKSDVVVGYRTYIELIRPLLAQKKVIATGMGSEIERMKTALDFVGKGKIVSVISSGDAGVYGMAALMGEMLAENPRQEIDIEVIPGIPALASSAALLGSPLSNDFACISLSDHLVPWEDICNRIRLAAQGDFVIVIYNPRSHQRPHTARRSSRNPSSYRIPKTP
jgi:cobalt-precorrin 5A hydrolase/precorrin-3B C17-methyltransferase